MALPYNKLCEVEDFADGDLAAMIRDIFPHDRERFGDRFPAGREYRKYWEIGMSVRALRDFGALHRESLILGVGAGTESTLFYLTRFAKLVFSTDVYVQDGAWSRFAPMRMLWDPQSFAPYDFEASRLVVQHMDGRFLDYPDGLFDGIFSSGSIEHFGGLQDAAYCAYEMGRVLKPGGVLTLSTEFCVAGPTEGVELPGLVLFTADQVKKYIIEASGLEPVDDLSTHLSDTTRATLRPHALYRDELDESLKMQGQNPKAGEMIWSVYPHIMLETHSYTFGSVHIVLRKSGDYPASDNSWARPTPEVIARKKWRPQFRNEPAPIVPPGGLKGVAHRLTPPLIWEAMKAAKRYGSGTVSGGG